MSAEERLKDLEQENKELREQLAEREAMIGQLLRRVQVLEERVAKDSHNSSLPPSSDRFSRQKKARSLRETSGKKAGGQDGHKGTTLEMSEVPDEVIALVPVTQCQHCQADLTRITATSRERRQVVDVPPPRLQVTEYQGEWKQCPHCQGYSSPAFPTGVTASVQYGPRVGAMAVYLVMQQLVPWSRTCEVLADLVGAHLSEARTRNGGDCVMPGPGRSGRGSSLGRDPGLADYAHRLAVGASGSADQNRPECGEGDPSR